MKKSNHSGAITVIGHHIIDVTIQSPGRITLERGPHRVSIAGAIGNIPWLRVMPMVEGLVDIVASAADVPRDAIRVTQELSTVAGSTDMIATYAIALESNVSEVTVDQVRSCAEIYVRRLKGGESTVVEQLNAEFGVPTTVVYQSVAAADKARMATKSASLPTALGIAVGGKPVSGLSGRLAPTPKPPVVPKDEVVSGKYGGFKHASRELYVTTPAGDLVIGYDEAKFGAQIAGLGSTWPCWLILDVLTEVSGAKSKRILTDIRVVTMHPHADPPGEDPNT